MRKVDEENETEEDEYGCTDESDIVAPEHEKPVRDEERYGHEDDPQKDFRAPPAILDGSSLVFRIFDANKESSNDEVEK